MSQPNQNAQPDPSEALTQPRGNPIADAAPTNDPPQPPHKHALPQQIGSYRIIEEIGEGGMGVVYKAEQRQPVRRVVALKVIKLGMDTREVVARFEAERQALAMLSHPNVAKVFEAGMTDTGRPYFAMEHVAGLPVNRYCDENKLTTRQRLELFIPICHAVQHAHQKGIIHRDLKPSNLLVTLFDGKPIPKVIDFGIAKATNSALTQHTLFTQTGAMMGTPQYMSPEQAMTSGMDVDTRTDIYSLGVVLYELLTGTLPFDPDTLQKASMEAMARIIKDTDPHKPSQRLTRTLPTKSTSTGPDTELIAKSHNTDLRTLRRQLRGDLDWIVLKAMEKDRTRRYETANGLAEDIRRHLEDEPVTARPPSTFYRASKFARKHKSLVVGATTVVIALLLGIAGTGFGMLHAVRSNQAEAQQRRLAQAAAELAQKQERRAEANEAEAATESAKAKALSVFLQDMLLSFSPENARSPTVSVRQVVDDAVHRLQKGALVSQPDAEAAALLTLGKIYISMSHGDLAVPQLQRALDLQKQVHQGKDHPDVANTMTYLSDALMRSNGVPAALPLITEAVAMNRRLHPNDNPDLALSLNIMGNYFLDAGTPLPAEPYYRESLDMRRRLFGDSQEVGTTLQNLAGVVKAKGDLATSEAMYKDALAMYRRVLGNDHPRLTYPLYNLAVLASDRSDFITAARYRSEALAIRKKVMGINHPAVISELLALFDLRRLIGDRAGMSIALHEAYDITRKSLEKDSPEIIGDPTEIAFRLYVFTQEYSMAETVLNDYVAKLASMDERPPFEELKIAYSYVALYRRAHNQSKLAQCQAILQKRFDAAVANTTDEIRLHPQDADQYLARGRLYGGQGMFTQASTDFLKAKELNPDDIWPWYLQGCILAYVGDTKEYQAHCQRMIEKFRASDSNETWDKVAKTSSLLPGGDTKLALDLSDRALSKATTDDLRCWLSLGKALALYRAGQTTQSIELAEKAKTLGDEQSFTRSATVDLILALDHQKLGQIPQAQAALNHALQRLEADAPKVNEGNLNWGALENRLICEVLLREAQSLIPTPSPAK